MTSRITSPRERRLWLALGAVIVALYATLGLAGTLARELENQDLLGVAFGAGLLLMVATVVASGWRRRAGVREVWVWIAIAVVYGMVLVRMNIGAERSHLFEYGLVGVLFHQALLERRRNGRRVPVPFLLAVVATALVGWIDEGIQWFLPGRVYDLRDVGFNALAGFLAVSGSQGIAWARGRLTRGPGDTA